MERKILNEQWHNYASLVSVDIIEKALSRPTRLMKEPITAVLPNIELGADSPVIRSVVFLSESYIGEAILAEGIEEFDLALRSVIANYRFNIGTHEVIRNAAAIEQAKSKSEKPPPADKLVYETATITLRHSYSSLGLATKLNYFGDKREEWLKHVIAHIPVDILKGALLR